MASIEQAGSAEILLFHGHKGAPTRARLARRVLDADRLYRNLDGRTVVVADRPLRLVVLGIVDHGETRWIQLSVERAECVLMTTLRASVTDRPEDVIRLLRSALDRPTEVVGVNTHVASGARLPSFAH